MDKTKILGIDVWPMSMQDVIVECDKHIQQRESLLIGVVNVAKLVNARKNLELYDSLLKANFVVADGLPIVWLSKLCGKPLPERVAGIDIMLELLSLANEKHYGVFFLGAKAMVVEEVVNWAEQHFPNMRLAGYRDGYFTTAEEESIAKQIRNSKADILFVAISPPKKEIFLNKYRNIMEVPVCHGVGGSFDVVSGKTKRAPEWMQKCALEWFYRVMQEPQRMWKRYFFTNLQFIGLSIKEIWKYRISSK